MVISFVSPLLFVVLIGCCLVVLGHAVAVFFLLHCIYERFNPNRSLEPVQILCIVEHVACLILEGVAGYGERIRRARCRQANER